MLAHVRVDVCPKNAVFMSGDIDAKDGFHDEYYLCVRVNMRRKLDMIVLNNDNVKGAMRTALITISTRRCFNKTPLMDKM